MEHGYAFVGCRAKSSETHQTSEDVEQGGAENDAEVFMLFSLTFLAKNSLRRQRLPHSRRLRASSNRSWNSENHYAASSCYQLLRSSRSRWVERASALGFLQCHLCHCPQVTTGSGVCCDAAKSLQRRHYLGLPRVNQRSSIFAGGS